MIAVQRATPIVRLMPVITALMASLSVGAANPAVCGRQRVRARRRCARCPRFSSSRRMNVTATYGTESMRTLQ